MDCIVTKSWTSLVSFSTFTFFSFLLDICTYFWKKCPLNTLPMFWFVFALLICKNSFLCILDTGPWSDIQCANILFHSMGHIFTFLICNIKFEIFISSNFFIMILLLLVSLSFKFSLCTRYCATRQCNKDDSNNICISSISQPRSVIFKEIGMIYAYIIWTLKERK